MKEITKQQIDKAIQVLKKESVDASGLDSFVAYCEKCKTVRLFLKGKCQICLDDYKILV